MAQTTLTPALGTHRRSPSGEPLSGAGLVLRKAASSVVNPGGDPGLVDTTVREVSSDMDAGSVDLRILIENARSANTYIIEADVPITRRAGTPALSGGSVTLELGASTSGGAALVAPPQNVQEFPDMADLSSAVEDGRQMGFKVPLQFNATTMGANWEDGTTVVLRLTIECEPNLENGEQVHVGSFTNGFVGVPSLVVTEVGG